MGHPSRFTFNWEPFIGVGILMEKGWNFRFEAVIALPLMVITLGLGRRL